MDELKLEQDERRTSVAASTSNTELDENKEVKHVFLLTAAWRMFSDFTTNSTVHGVRYLGERRRHWSERVFWIIVFLISITGCSFVIVNLYDKWQQNPIISSIIETAAFDIPQPAITICPQIKASRKYMDYLKVSSDFMTKFRKKYKATEKFLRFEALNQICDRWFFNKNMTLASVQILPTLQQISLNQEEVFSFCRVKITWNDWQICEEYFTEIVTEEGKCFTLNMLNSSDIFRDNILDPKFVSLNHNETSQHWSLQGGYITNDEDVYPRRVFGVGLESGLDVALVNDEKSSNNTCLESENGYKVVLHSPGDIPRFNAQTLIVPMIKKASIIIKPSIITTSKGLRSYSPERRQCFYEDERYLKFFKVYTQSNCELECLTNHTLEACGCVRFSMPRDKNTSICNFEQIDCSRNAKLDFISKKSFDIFMPKKTLKENECNCMPSCTSIKYDYEFIQKSDQPTFSILRLDVSFIEAKVPTTVRSELYGIFEFIGNCGGLMGLFMGVSFLSVIELIYYFTLRLACNLGCRRKHHKTSPATIVVDEATEVNINTSQTQIESPENGQFMN